jgi:spore germination cell wall hydrolase CwlJ-like protein
MSDAASLRSPNGPASQRGQAAKPINALRHGGAVRVAAPVRSLAPSRAAPKEMPREVGRDLPREDPMPDRRLQAAFAVALLIFAVLLGLLLEPQWRGGKTILPPSVIRVVQSVPGLGAWFTASLKAPPASANSSQALPPPTVAPDDLLPNAVLDLAPDEAKRRNAAVPVSIVRSAFAEPFVMPLTDLAVRNNAVQCMTAAIYYEAGNEPDAGQRAVAQVILNRMRHPAYPKSVCGVIFQGSERNTGCQFTFSCDGSLRRPPNPVLWRRAQTAAEASLNGWVERSVGLATHYHADYVVPRWAASLVKTQVIGAHIFYRWAGGWGTPAAFSGKWAGTEAPVGGLPAIQTPEMPPLVMASAEPVSTLERLAAEHPVTGLAETVVALAPPPPPVAPKVETPVPTTPVLLAPAPNLTPVVKTVPRTPGASPRLAVPSNW